MTAANSARKPSILAAIVTPRESVSLDLATFERLLKRLTEAGMDGVLIGGSTGRGDLLSGPELSQLLGLAERSTPKLKRIAGFGAKALPVDEVLSRIEAHEGEAEAFLIAAPDDDREVLHYFEVVTNRAATPVLLYHPPARKQRPFPRALIEDLVQIEGLLGAKDSTGIEDLIPSWQSAGPRFQLYLGSIRLFAGHAAAVHGAILAFLNLRPDLGRRLQASEPGALAAYESELRRVEGGGLEALIQMMKEEEILP